MTTDDTRPRRYFALHYTLFRFLGLGWWHHPDEDDTRNFQGWYLYYSIITQILCVASFIILETIDPFIGEKDMNRFMINVSFVITHDLTLIKICILIYRNKQIQDIVHTLEIKLYDFYQNNKKTQTIVRITRIISSSFLFFGWMTIANTNAYGFIQDRRWKAEVAVLNDTSLIPPRILPQPIWIPWNFQSDRAYVFSLILESIGLLWTGHIVVTVDTFIGSLILHMSGQFAILREALETAYDRTITSLYYSQDVQETLIPTDDLTTYDDSTQNAMEASVIASYSAKDIEVALERTLRSCFRQHQLLIGCVEKFAKIYSWGFMTQLLSSTSAICVVMVQISQDASRLKSVKLVTSLAFFMAMIIQLAIQCFTGNELTLQASRISDAVMDCKWERMSPRLRRQLLLTMMKAQRPLRLSAAGFVYMNNDCFLAIMKAAYSYYAVLSQKQGQNV